MIRKKLAIELALGPILYVNAFLITGLIRGKSRDKIWSEIKANFAYFMAVDLCVYAPFQYLNFYYVPPQFRMLYVEGIEIAYDLFFIYLLNRVRFWKRIHKERYRIFFDLWKH